MRIREVIPDEGVIRQLIAFSEAWERENSCYGYRANRPGDLEGNRVFLAQDGEETIGYLFGKVSLSKNMRSVMPEGTPFFEVEELYVVPERRSQGVGTALFRFAEQAVSAEAEYILLSAAAKDRRAILHFYLDELGMEMWSARLFRRIR